MTDLARVKARLGPAAVAIGLVLLLVPLSDASRPAVVVEDETNLSSSPMVFSEHPRVAVTNDGTIHVVWEEGINIVHRYQLYGRGDWSPPSIVFRQAYDPTIATDGNTVVVAFVRGRRDAADASEDTEILYKIWQPERTWPLLAEQVQETVENIALDGQQPDVALSPDGSALWLTWVDTTWGEQQPYYARIRLADHHVDGGAIDPQSHRAQGPAIAIAPEGRVHVVWSEQSDLKKTAYVAHASRTDASPWEVDPSPYFLQVRQARAPAIAISQSHWCIAWHENTSRLVAGTPQPNNEIALHCDGREWNISNSTAHSLMPSLAVDDLRGQMVLWKKNTETREIVFRQGPPPPANSEATIGEGQVDTPAEAYHDGYAYGVWSRQSGTDADIYVARWAVAIPTPTPTLTPSPVPSATPTRGPVLGVIYCPFAEQTR